MDTHDTLYMIVDVEYDEYSSPKYRLYNVESGVRFSLYVNALDNPNLVRWLTPPRQKPVAQPPQRQNVDTTK